MDQATLGMPGREYLIKGLEDKDVKAYLEYQVGLAALLGADRESARKEQTEALEFEIKLATVRSNNNSSSVAARIKKISLSTKIIFYSL